MRKKKKNTPIVLAVVVGILALTGVLGIRAYVNMNKNQPKTESESETEIPKHDVLIYKTSSASIEFEKKWMTEDGEEETHLSIRKGTYVTMLVKPKARQILTSVDIVDVKNHFTQVESIIRRTSSGAFRVIFTMPDNDIMMNFNFDEEAFPETEQEPIMPESETQTEGSPYGLTLHGLTADIITSYNGEFDDTFFLQQLGDALRMDSKSSEYRNVTDVTFSQDEYKGDKDSDKVYHYIYFNDDPDWKLLSTYYMKDNSYVFTEVAEEETKESEEISPAAAGSSRYQSSYGGNTYGGSSYSKGVSSTVETSFDILAVSTNLIKFCGDKDSFYQAAFDYILSRGNTGVIVGTMSGYEIDPEKQTAEFRITLNIGGTIAGTYDKEKDKYSFSGL